MVTKSRTQGPHTTHSVLLLLCNTRCCSRPCGLCSQASPATNPAVNASLQLQSPGPPRSARRARPSLNYSYSFSFLFLSRLLLKFLFRLHTNSDTGGGHFAFTMRCLCLACSVPPEGALSPPCTIHEGNETDHHHQATQRPLGKPAPRTSRLRTASPDRGDGSRRLLTNTPGRGVHPVCRDHQTLAP